MWRYFQKKFKKEIKQLFTKNVELTEPEIEWWVFDNEFILLAYEDVDTNMELDLDSWVKKYSPIIDKFFGSVLDYLKDKDIIHVGERRFDILEGDKKWN